MKRRLLLIFLAALGLRALFLFEASQAPFFEHPVADSNLYHKWAIAIASGDLLGDSVFWVDPLYAYFLAGLRVLTRGSLIAPLVIQVLLGSLNCLVIYLIGRKLFGEKAGLLAAFMAVGYKLLIFYDGLLLKTSLTTLLVCSSLLVLLDAGEKKRMVQWGLGGILVGLCCVARSSCLLLVPCVMLWTFSLNWKGTRFGLLNRLALFLAGTALVVLPVTWRNHAVSGDFVLLTANLGQNLYLGNNPYNRTGTYTAPPFIREASEHEEKDWRRHAQRSLRRKLSPSEVSGFWVRKTLDWIASEPKAFLILLGKKLRLTWSAFEVPDNYDVYFYEKHYAPLFKAPLFTFGLVAPLALLGLLLAAGRWRRRFLLYLYLLCLSSLPMVFFVFARFRVPYVPLLCLFAAHAVVTVIRFFIDRRWLKLAASLVLAGLFSFGVNAPIPGMDPSLSVKPYYNLGTIFQERKDFPKAEAWYKKALEVAPWDPDIHNNLGCIYLEKGRDDEALKRFQKAIELDPNDEHAHRNLAHLFWKRHEYEKALKEYRIDARINPIHRLELLTRETAYYFNNGKYREAKRAVLELLRMRPHHADTLVLLAQVNMKLGDSGEAENNLLQALDENPKLGKAHFLLAKVYAEASPPDLERARGHLKRARELGYTVPEDFVERLNR